MPNAIVCTDRPGSGMPGESLLHFEGLLPSCWSREAQDELLACLSENSDVHLGEVGLDRRFTDVLPLERQAEVLSSLLDFAVQNRRLVSLHCVQATGLMLQVLGKADFRANSVLWHGYSGSVETARELARLKVLISVGPRFRGDLKALFAANPNLVLETDYEGSDPIEHQRLLESHYKVCSSILGLDLQEHCERVFRLFSCSR